MNAIATGTASWPEQALIGRGQVRHRRLRPAQHAFAYRSYFLMLPLRALRRTPCPALHRNGRFSGLRCLSFSDADHGEGGPDCLAWLDDLLAREGVPDADGEVWLHCYPRVLGHAFKPVSFWYCQRADGGLAAIVVEVNNTFGERHCYLLQGPDLALGRELLASKVFHVSPFCRVAGRYRFRFMHSSGPAGQWRTVARVDHEDEFGELLLQTSISGQLQPLTEASARAAFFAMPALSLMVLARIHWQAMRLWLKRVPFFGKPSPPESLLSR
ncbi:DUF1365 domain-containing protein [Roseateles oligotrophus]|uniref:DUF1365 domain-containing protein n=1 Tax=Roseateles oligotrophus TaxID=1769250 RepID=A0ABT2YK39_9BURK|nr:DUF1365 domain-containing protein [Roseateles oligotrophus]MCV2370336.1 DUF1365 domain-containing protein [Roseateles oligotrophus]